MCVPYVITLLNWTYIIEWYIWQGLYVEMGTRMTHVMMRLDWDWIMCSECIHVYTIGRFK